MTGVERAAALALAVGRLAIGAGIWAAPRTTMRVLGLEQPGADGLAVARIAGTRDLILGSWQLRAVGDRERLRRATWAAAACDAGDALTFALLLRGGRARPGLRGVAAAAPAAALGLWLASRLSADQ